MLTLHAFEDPARAEPGVEPASGHRYVAADIEGCAGRDVKAATLNPYQFELQMPDNRRVTADVGWRSPPLHDTTLPPGDCVRGWITFEVANDPAFVVFASSSIVRWRIQ